MSAEEKPPTHDPAVTTDNPAPSGPPPAAPVAAAALAPAEPPFDPMGDPGFSERYVLEGVLGRGGMGIVYRGTQRALRRDVAIKFLLPERILDMRRFEREGALAARLDHRNVVRVHEGGINQGHPYLVMELVHGETLSQRLERSGGRLPVPECVGILEQVLDGLEHIHAAGALHRDLKPANIFVTPDGLVKIGDFGIAWHGEEAPLTRPGDILGTPLYMSPEQFTGEAREPASDLYALGAVLHSMLTGHPPFREPTLMAYFEAHRTRVPPPIRNLDPGLPSHIESLVQAALEKDPARRPRTCAHFRRLLRLTPTPGAEVTLDGPPAAPLTVTAQTAAPRGPAPVGYEERTLAGAGTLGATSFRELACLAVLFACLMAGLHAHAKRRSALPEWPRVPVATEAAPGPSTRLTPRSGPRAG